ncbi:hypothetical protein Tco_0372485, partial [Tanacetum coccineum]
TVVVIFGASLVIGSDGSGVVSVGVGVVCGGITNTRTSSNGADRTEGISC